MGICRNCGGEFDWALVDDRWELLEPLGSDADLDRSFVDENGELRANHRDRHQGGVVIQAHRLERRIPPERVAEEAPLHRRVAEAARHVVGKG